MHWETKIHLTHFTAIFTSLWRYGTKPTVSLRYACKGELYNLSEGSVVSLTKEKKNQITIRFLICNTGILKSLEQHLWTTMQRNLLYTQSILGIVVSMFYKVGN